MAKNWDEIASSDEFKKLSPEDQEATREYYFLKRIVPNTPTAELARARYAFDDETAPTVWNKAKKAVKGAAGGALDVVKTGLTRDDLGNRTLGGSVMDGYAPQEDPRASQPATSGVAPVSALGQAKLQELATVNPDAAAQLAAKPGAIGDAALAEVEARQDELDRREISQIPNPNQTELVADALNEGTRQRELERIGREQRIAQEGGIGREWRYQMDNARIGLNTALNAIDGVKMQDFAGMARDGVAGAAENEAKTAMRIQQRNAEIELMKSQGRESTKKFYEADKNADTMGTLANLGSALVEGNIGLLADVTLQSGVPSAVGLAAAAVMSRFAGPTAGAAAGGAGSAFIEFGNGYAARRAQGESHDEATKNAAIKAGVIGLFDAVSFKTAGNALADILNAGASKLGHTAKTVGKELGTQAALGGGGEAWGSFAVGERPSLPEVAAEMVGELGTGPMEAIATYKNAQTKPEAFGRVFERMIDSAKFGDEADAQQTVESYFGAPKLDDGSVYRQRPVEAPPAAAGLDPRVEPTAGEAPPDQLGSLPAGATPAGQVLGEEEGEEAAPPAAKGPGADIAGGLAGPNWTGGSATQTGRTDVTAGPGVGIDSVKPKGKDKPFDPVLAANAAYNAPENAKVKEAWNQAHLTTGENGEQSRVKHDHFESWHAGGGVTAEVGNQFDSHGIAKSNPLGALLNMLQNGVNTSRRFDTAPLVPISSGTGAGLGTAGGAYKDGPFIVLGAAGKTIAESGIQTVLVSDAVASVIPTLQERFPNVEFVPYSQAQAVLSKKAQPTGETTSEPQAPQAEQGETSEPQAPTTGTTGGGSTTTSGPAVPRGPEVGEGAGGGTTTGGVTETPPGVPGAGGATGGAVEPPVTPPTGEAPPTTGTAGEAPTPPKPKDEITVDTPVSKRQAKNRWTVDRTTLADADKPAFAGEDEQVKMLDGKPHIVSADGSKVFHYVRDADKPKTLALKPGFASDAAKAEHEAGQESGEQLEDPIENAIANNDAEALAKLLYGEKMTITPDMLPIIMPDDKLIRMHVADKHVADIEKALASNNFRITDRLIPIAADTPDVPQGFVTISAVHKKKIEGIDEVGGEMGHNRRGKQTTPPKPVTKDATDGKITALIESLRGLLDIEANGNQTFGAMMLKEAFAENIEDALDVLARNARHLVNVSDRAGPKQAIKRALESGLDDEINEHAQAYFDAVITLQGLFESTNTVQEFVDAFNATYFTKDGDGNYVENDEAYPPLFEISKDGALQKRLVKYAALFGPNEHSTDQTYRVKKKDAEKPQPLSHVVRKGLPDHREGKDVSTDDIAATFRLGKINFGDWVNNTERATHANMIYDALMDFAHLTGLPPAALGSNGKLSLAVGAQGQGGRTAAWFVPSLGEINLTKTKGDGSLGHEWMHSIDHFLRRSGTRGSNVMTDLVQMLQYDLPETYVDDRIRGALRNNAADLKNRNTPPKEAAVLVATGGVGKMRRTDIYENWKRTSFFNDAAEMDGAEGRSYWSTGKEMVARGTESFLFDAAKGGTPYLVGSVVREGFITKANGYAGTIYPIGKDRQRVFDLIKKTFALIDENGNVKTYTPTFRKIHIEGVGWTAVDQHGVGTKGDRSYDDNGYGLAWFNTEADLDAHLAQANTSPVLTPMAEHVATLNAKAIELLQNIDKIMEEMGIFKWPYLKDDSMAESMFFHLRQGWWPKDNADLKTYVAKAHKLDANNDVTITMMRDAQQDFEAALAAYLGQRVDDMRRQGSDDKMIYDELVKLYLAQPNINSKTAVTEDLQQFSTPAPLAFLAGLLGRVKPSTKVLEPTAGNGLLALTANSKNVTAIEMDEHRLLNLRQMEFGRVIAGDARTALDALHAQEADVVLANPPFGSNPGGAVRIPSWTGEEAVIGKLDHVIAAKALRVMADNGRAVLIIGAPMQAGTLPTSTERPFFNWLYSNYNVTDHFEVSGDLYKRMGAGAPIRILVIAGRNHSNAFYKPTEAVERVNDFDELWSRFVLARESSEKVVVDTKAKPAGAGGAAGKPGAVPTGDSAQNGGADPQGGAGGSSKGGNANAGAGSNSTGQPGNSGDDAGSGQPGTTGEGNTGQVPGVGANGQSGKPGSSSAASGKGSGKNSGGAGGTDVGGLSDLDLDGLFDEEFGGDAKPKTKRAKGEGQPSTPKTTGGPSTPRAPSAPRAPTVGVNESGGGLLDGLGLDDLFGEIDGILGGAPTPPAAPKKPRAKKEKPVETPAPQPTPAVEPLVVPVAAPAPAIPGNYLDLLNGMAADAASVRAAVAKLAAATGEMGPQPKGAKARYSRANKTNEAEYQSTWRAILARVWNTLSEKIADMRQRIITFVQGLQQKYGEQMKAYALRYLKEVQEQEALQREADRRARENQKLRSKNPIVVESVDNANQVVYHSRSRGKNDGIFVPRSQAEAVNQVMDAFEAKHGDVDEYVRKKMGYATVEELHKALFGYQVDAVALALGNLDKGNGFIIGDDTGVGKGRTAASILAWAAENGKVPIFLTYKNSLYSDMYRDMKGIGKHHLKIAMTNSDGIVTDKDLDGEVIYKNTQASASNLISHLISKGELPAGIDMLFTTYDQIAAEGNRREALAALVKSGKAVLVMDESHTASGDQTIKRTRSGAEKTPRAAFIMRLLTGEHLFGNGVRPPDNWKPPGVVYLSGTFAKRADNMPVYIRTALRMAANTPSELVSMFKNGGNVLLMEASEMLVKAGSMIRRERSYAGVDMQFPIDEANAARDSRLFDQVTEILRGVIRADRAFQAWVEDGQVQQDIIETYQPADPGATASAGTLIFDQMGEKNSFTSIIHNVIGQLLLATKVDSAVKTAVEKMNGTKEYPGGQKIVFSFQNTMEAAIKEYAEQNGIEIGEEMPGFGWRQILERSLNTARRINVTSSLDPDKVARITVPYDYANWPPNVKNEFDATLQMIANLESSLPGAPIDMLIKKLEDYSVYWETGEDGVEYQRVVPTDEVPEGVESRPMAVGEVTGRSLGVDYSEEVPKLKRREKVKVEDTIRGYQEGHVDVLLINSSGSTGLSAHAAEDAIDQRPRHMFVLQPNPDVAVFKQTLGRIHRTGQVEWPFFTMFGTGIPAERRALAVAQKKFKALSSNTSAGSSAVGLEAEDFLNMYGDPIVAEYLIDHPDIAVFMGFNPDNIDPGKLPADFAHSVSGKVSYLTVDEQQDFYDTIEQQYKAVIEMRNATGTNELVRTEMPLDAKLDKDRSTGGEVILEPGLNENNPFTSTARMAAYKVNILGDIPTAASVRDAIDQALNGKTMNDIIAQYEADLKTAFEAAQNSVAKKMAELQAELAGDMTEKAREEKEAKLAKQTDRLASLDTERNTVLRALRHDYNIGRGYSTFNLKGVEAKAVIVGVRYDKPKGKDANPFTPAAFKIAFQRNLPGPRVELSLANLRNPSTVGLEIDGSDYRPWLEDWFAMHYAVGGRQTRYIATGNILRALTYTEGRGDIVRFTYAQTEGATQSTVATGILMPPSYRPGNLQRADFKFRFATAASNTALGIWKGLLEDAYGRGYMSSTDSYLDALEDYDRPDAEAIDTMRNGSGNVMAFTRVLEGTDPKASGTASQTFNWEFSVDTRSPSRGPMLRVYRGPQEKGKPVIDAISRLVGQPMEKPSGGAYWTLAYPHTAGLTDPVLFKKIVEILHDAAPATVRSTFAEFAQEQQKAHYEKEAGDDGSMFSRSGTRQGSTVAKVEQWTAGARAKFAKQGIETVVVQRVSDLPDSAAPSDVEGVWYDGTDTVYLVADNLGSRRRAQGVLAHEAVGHALLEDMLGEHLMNNLVKEVNALEAQGNMTIRALGKVVDLRQPGLDKNDRAREIVALMAERRMQHRIWRRIANAVRNWLRGLGFDIAFSDKDIDTLLQNAEKHVYGGEEAMPEYGSLQAAYSRTPSQLVQALRAIAAHDSVFQWPRVTNTNIYGIVRTFKEAGFRGELRSYNERADGTIGIWFKLPVQDEKTKITRMVDVTAKVSRRGKERVLELNIGKAEEGSGGSALYNLLGQWAHNNQIKFIGDSSGVSNKAMYRRAENMLSLALKLGSTEYLEPHPDQLHAWNGERNGQKDFYWPGMEWYGKDFNANIDSMARAVYDVVTHHVPEIEKVRYDFPTGKFINRSTGKDVPGSFFRALAKLRSGGAGRASAGSTTLERAVVISSVLAGDSGFAGRADVDGGVSEQPAQLSSASVARLKGRFYSRNGAQTGRWWQTTGQAVQGRKEGGIGDRVMQKIGGSVLAEKVTKPAYEWLKHAALERDWGGDFGKFVDTIRAGIVSDHGLDDAYLDRRTDMHVAVNKQLRNAKDNIIAKLQGLTREESRIVYWWLNTSPEEAAEREAELLEQIPEDSRQLLQEVKELIMQLGEEAVELGQLSRDSFNRNKMAYLHRDYAEHVFGKDGAADLARLRANASRIIGEQLKGRGLFFEIEGGKITSDVGNLQAMLGQKFLRLEKRSANGKRVLKRVWVPADAPIPEAYEDFAVDAAPWEVRVVKNGKATMWRDFTQEEQEQMGVMDEAKYGIAITIAQLAKDVEMGKFFRWIGESYAVEDAEDLPEDAKVLTPRDIEGAMGADFLTMTREVFGKDTWVKVPDSAITDTGGKKKYGDLAGKYIPGPIWNDLRQLRQRPLPFGQLYDKLLGMWKISKTALSPAVHMNNVMANFFMADMHDVTPQDVFKAMDLLWRKHKGDEEAKALFERFEDSGALGGTFVMSDLKAELLGPLLDQLRAEMRGEFNSLGMSVQLSMVWSLVREKKWKQAMNALALTKGAGMAKKLPQILMELYQGEDTVFRLAKFVQAVEIGKSDRDAGKASREAFLNYEINAPWVQNARHTMLPFIAFSYRMIPMALDVAANKPWKIAKYALYTNLLVMLAMSMAGVDDDEWKRLKKLMPEDKTGVTPFLVERQIPLGKDAHGRPIVLDITRWVPMGDVFELRGDQANMMPIWAPVYPSGPLMILAEAGFNRSLFTGKEIYQETATRPEAIADMSKHIWRSMMPNILGLGLIGPDTYADEKVRNALRGKTDALGREYSVPLAVVNAFGVKASAQDVASLTRNAYLEFKDKQEELNTNMWKLTGQYARHGLTREEYDAKMRAEQQKLEKLYAEFREKMAK